MHSIFVRFVAVFALFLPMLTSAQNSPPAANGGDFSNPTGPLVKVPIGAILVKGAWSSASDSVTPLPEGGAVTNKIFVNKYFGTAYPLPAGWMQWHEGPPPSDSGRYVLTQLRPADSLPGHTRGTILITAQDNFFAPHPGATALQLMKDAAEDLQADYKVEQPPTPTKVAGRPFAFFAYWSPVAELHWYVLATQIRCHTIEFVMASRDTKLLENLVLEMDKMTLPAETSVTSGSGAGDFPVCIYDYVRSQNMTTKADPVFSENKFNPVPVRIIIDKTGKVKHIHFLSAFPGQAKAITDALSQWKFKPYIVNGQPVEVETGIMFGHAQHLNPQRAPVNATD